MYKTILTIAFGWILFLGMPLNQAHACDACGLFSGVTPMDLKSQVGLYFRYRPFAGLNIGELSGSGKTSHIPGVSEHVEGETYNEYRENFHRIALNVRWFFSDRWNVQASLPFTANNERWPGEIKSGAGFGDATLVLNRGLIVKDQGNHSLRLFLGGGLKLPTGWRFPGWADRIDFIDIQGSTESLDFIVQTEANWRFGENGIMANVVCRFNTVNPNGIRYGNFYNANLNFFRKIDLPGWEATMMPYVGGYFEAYSGRFRHDVLRFGTGGKTLFANTGMHFFVGKMGIRPEVKVPLWQKLKGVQIKSKAIASLNLDYFF